MSDNTLVIQLLEDGSLNVVLTSMDIVKGGIKGRTNMLNDMLAETLEFSDEPTSSDMTKLTELGWMVNYLVSELEMGK